MSTRSSPRNPDNRRTSRGKTTPRPSRGACSLTFAKKIDIVPSIAETSIMKTLTEVLPDVDQLSEEEQAGLVAHLLANLRGAPLGPDDKELARREAEIDAGTAELITFDELRKAVGR